MEQMIAQFAHLLVDKETRTGQKQQQPVDLSVVKTEITEEEEEEEMEQGEMSFADMMNLSKPVEGEAEKTLDKQNPQASNTIHGDMDRQEKEEDVGGESDLELELELQSDDDDEYSEAEEIDQQEVEDFIPNWRQVLEYEDRIPMNFGRHPTEEYTKEWRASRFEDKHRKARMAQNKEANVVKFAPFGSSLNRMRIFEKPNGHFFHCGDDGPITNYVDLSLKNGWKTLLRTNSGPPLVVHKTPLEGFGRQLTNHCQRITTPVQPYMKGYHGNIFGRFWFPRDPEYDKTLESSSREPNYDDDDEENFIYYPEDDDEHSSRRDNGFLRQYTQRELHLLYSSKLNEIHQQMRRGTVRKLERADVKGGGGVSGGEVASVLLLTDWRLAHFSTNPVVLTNAIVQFMPTNLGDVFFKTMAEYLTELLLDANIEIRTIIFAFGGSPRFKKEDFLRFWKKLTVQTMQRVDVIWTAQDWWDGLRPTLEQQQELAEFNDYVKRMFEAMRRSGYRNYKFWNIRERLEAQGKKFETPVVARVPDTQLLEPMIFF
uniref:Uncharacterized protein n=1 Tax=Caenorhabditis japonica TaxID=281687 RepID=A0A8R1I5N3_CAEJA